MKKQGFSTSWGKVADWYDAHLSEKDTYHEKVVLPNLLRAVSPQKNEVILDVPCGQGYFSKELAKKGTKVLAIDISKELIASAERTAEEHIRYFVSPSHKLDMIKDASVDKIIMVLGIQNIKEVDKTFQEFSRVLKKNGTLSIVMNHPAFRIPKTSSWGWDKERSIQYRRLDSYMSESTITIEMRPGKKDEHTDTQTISFHRPLQWYIKLLAKNGFAVDKLEEWISHKKSDSGPKAEAENVARNEFPLFLYLRGIKIKG